MLPYRCLVGGVPQSLLQLKQHNQQKAVVKYVGVSYGPTLSRASRFRRLQFMSVDEKSQGLLRYP